MMKLKEIKSCYLGPEISPEQFVPEHMFIFLAQGVLTGFDGKNRHQLHAGQCCVVRKNHLIRYNKQPMDGHFEKVVVIFEQSFLQGFADKYPINLEHAVPQQAYVEVQISSLLQNFIHSLAPYYQGAGNINQRFAELKREELLLILLQQQPDLARILFDFRQPGKLDLKAFMQKNYKFNVNLERFAYLSGRSLAAFKRDFKEIFQLSPAAWLTAKRLDEAHFLIEQKHQKPSDIYLELGFENLSHFSFSFKKRFGYNPSQLMNEKRDRLTDMD
ncbi:helix-turn-helix transcriptional regulator [Vibrio fluvialis]|nr:helix-turn-helix transcriptional regulator [Vibrio fluvialis]EKO3945441.1 helix-turn-helix transcriptional regulator [Vibrio fluvialis]